MSEEFFQLLGKHSALTLHLRQAKQVLTAIRDDAKTLEEAQILAQSIMGKKTKQ